MSMGDKHAKGRAQEAKRAAQRALREAKKSVQKPLWVPPSRAECDDVQEIPETPNETTRIMQVMSYLDGRLVYFAFMHDTYHQGEWRNVTRIDCSHGTVHQHFFTQTGGESNETTHIVSLHSINDVNGSWDLAYGMIFDCIEENERRWRHG